MKSITNDLIDKTKNQYITSIGNIFYKYRMQVENEAEFLGDIITEIEAIDNCFKEVGMLWSNFLKIENEK